MNGILADLRTAVRTLLKARGFTSIAILTLGTGLALCITVLTVINAYLIRALPYPAASRLYSLDLNAPGQGPPRGVTSLDWSSLDDVIEQQISWDLDVFYLLGGAYPENTPGAWVTPGFLEGLGIRAALGRSFTADDFQVGRPMPALIGHGLWQRRFGGEPSVLGRTVNAYVSDRPDEPEMFTIVGVLPADFWHVNPYTDIMAPLRAPSYPYMVRLREGVTPVVAVDRIAALVKSGASSVPVGWRPVLTSPQARYTADARPVLLAVGAASALVLLIACANVAVLLLVRGTRRRHEIAIRRALGASRAQIARLLALDALVLGVTSTALGVFAGLVLTRRLAPLLARQIERPVPGGLSSLALDETVVLGAAVCGFVTIAVCALAPLAATWRMPLSPSLATSGRGSTENRGTRHTRSVLVAIELAASLSLLAGSSLMVESTLRMLRVDFGFRPDDVLSSSIGLRQRTYPDAAARAVFFDRLRRSLADTPGGPPVALGDWWPLQGTRTRTMEAEGGASAEARVVAVSAEYFSTLGLAFRDGETFTAAQDRLGGEAAVVVSESVARRLWPRARAVGHTLRIGADRDPTAQAFPTACLVVGVVNDVRQTHTDQDQMDVYVPLFQRPGRYAFVYLRGAAPVSGAAQIQKAVADIDAEASVGTPRLLVTLLDRERAKVRLLAWLLSGFAAFSGLLALVGVYGVIAYAVRQREREIGVRMAIGADRRSVTRLFVRQGGGVLLVGLAAGLLGSVAIGRVLGAQLFGVEPGEPRVLAAATLAFGLCALLAIWWPARRAASVDPVRALRQE